MALQIKHTDATGVMLPEAYCRVEHVVLEPGRAPGANSASWRVVIYRDAAARKDPSLAPVTNIEYRVDGEKAAPFSVAALRTARTDPYSQAYACTKALPEWADALDV